MKILLLDTNSWIYLANGYNTEKGDSKNINDPYFDSIHKDTHFSLLEKIEAINRDPTNNIEIVTTDIIVNEWSRNGDAAKTLINILKNFKYENKKHAFSIKFIDKKKIRGLLDEANSKLESKIVLQEKHVGNVQKLLYSLNETNKISIDSQLKLKVVEFALEKSIAPFRGDKNGVADALILLGFVSYLRELKQQGQVNVNGILVSNNTSDFCDGEDVTKFHPSLLNEIAGVSIRIETNIAKALDATAEEVEKVERFNEMTHKEEAVHLWLEKLYTDNYSVQKDIRLGRMYLDILIERIDKSYVIVGEIKIIGQAVENAIKSALDYLDRVKSVVNLQEYIIVIVTDKKTTPDKIDQSFLPRIVRIREDSGITVKIFIGSIENNIFLPFLKLSDW